MKKHTTKIKLKSGKAVAEVQTEKAGIPLEEVFVSANDHNKHIFDMELPELAKLDVKIMHMVSTNTKTGNIKVRWLGNPLNHIQFLEALIEGIKTQQNKMNVNNEQDKKTVSPALTKAD